jgi:hypothetical protein
MAADCPALPRHDAFCGCRNSDAASVEARPRRPLGNIGRDKDLRLRPIFTSSRVRRRFDWLRGRLLLRRLNPMPRLAFRLVGRRLARLIQPRTCAQFGCHLVCCRCPCNRCRLDLLGRNLSHRLRDLPRGFLRHERPRASAPAGQRDRRTPMVGVIKGGIIQGSPGLCRCQHGRAGSR